MGQDDDERDKEKTASGGGYQVGAYGLSNGLREHIGQYDEGHEWKACIYQRAEGYKNCPKCRRKKKID